MLEPTPPITTHNDRADQLRARLRSGKPERPRSAQTWQSRSWDNDDMADYSAADIELLTYREAVRKRPGMYIGGTGPTGRTHLVLELLGNCFDLVLLRRATRVEVIWHEDGSVEVLDDGPGLDLADLEVRSWFADGHRRPTADGHTPHVHLAHFGVGAAVVNFLSERFEIETSFDGSSLRCEWVDGGLGDGAVAERGRRFGSGTSVRFWPDPAIFDGVAVPMEPILERVRELACLEPGVTFIVDGQELRYDSWKSGFQQLISLAMGPALPVSAVEHEAEVDGDRISARLMLFEVEDSSGVVVPQVYANYVSMSDEGAFTQALRSHLAQLTSALSERVDGGDGIVVPMVSLTMLQPEISGPTRARLDDPRTVQFLDSVFAEHAEQLLNDLVGS